MISRESLGFDEKDREERPFRCLKYFDLQMFLVGLGLLPQARITFDGSGVRQSQTVEEWGSALGAAAAKFKPGRR